MKTGKVPIHHDSPGLTRNFSYKRRKQWSKIGRLFTGLGVFVLVCLLIAWFTTLEFLIPASFTHWLSQARYPALALALFSVALASFIRVMIWLGVKIPPLKDIIESAQGAKWDYLLGLPVGMVMVLGAASLVGLFAFRPACNPPVIIFQIHAGDQSWQVEPGGILKAAPGSSLTLTAMAQDNDMLNCSWAVLGRNIQSLSPRSACTVNLILATEPGRGLLALSAKQGFCTIMANAPIEVSTLEK